MKKIVLIGLKRIGDAVYTLPLLEAIRSQMPAEIDVLTEPQVKDLYASNPHIRNVFVYRKKEFWQGALNQLKQENYDVCIILHNAFKYALLPFLARVPVRIGYVKELRGFLLTHKHTLPKDVVHRLEHNARLSDFLGIQARGILPKIYFSDQENDSKMALLNTLGLKERSFVTFIVGSIAETRRWFPFNFARVAEMFVQNYDLNVCILGGPEDFGIGEEVLNLYKGNKSKIYNLAGNTSLRETMMLFECSKVVVTNDTGPLHVASAIGVPVITWFGAANEQEIAPPSPKTMILNAHVSCGPCVKEVCPQKTLECLHKITPQMVEATYQKMFLGNDLSNENV